MRLRLGGLAAQHALVSEVADFYVLMAAHALQRRHQPGVAATLRVDRSVASAVIEWVTVRMEDARQLDAKRVTEDGAMAMGLSVVHGLHGWVVARRLQQGEHADWLLRDPITSERVALEVSGTDDGDDAARLREKLDQVRLFREAELHAACVVRFLDPRITLATLAR